MKTTIRTLAATAAAAVTVTTLGVPAAQADFNPGFDLTTQQVNVETFRQNVISEMQGKAFGWQLAIAQDGQLKVTDKRGTAVSQADNNGTAIAMQPTMRMELASVTKNITAVATLKLLRRNGLTVESKIWPYLPSNWDFGPGFTNLRFRHLLTHTSGINQAINAMPEDERPPSNSWSSMRIVAENPAGVVPGSQRQYKNANYALLRMINAVLWDQSGGAKYETEVVEVENWKGIVIDTYEVEYKVPVTEGNHTTYVLDYMRKHIFEPAGLYGIGCISNGVGPVRSYPLSATQNSSGSVLGTGTGECAGARGIAMSAVQLVQYLAHLRHGSIIHPDDLAVMDSLRAGWNEDSNGGDGGENGVLDGVADNWRSPGVFWHGGDLLGDRQLHTCAMTFEDGTEAALLVNSQLTSGTQCGALIKAYVDAM